MATDQPEGHCEKLKWKMGDSILISKDRLTLQFNGNYMIAARKSCQWWKSSGRHCDQSLLSWAPCYSFSVSCLAKNSMCDDDVRWYLFAGHTLCIWFPFSCFHKHSVSDMKNRREEQILFLCVSAFIFHPKMMEINIGSLLWLHSKGAWGAGERWFQHSDIQFYPPAHSREGCITVKSKIKKKKKKVFCNLHMNSSEISES